MNAPKPKLQMRLDPTLPKTHSAPVHPSTGQPDEELFWRLQQVAQELAAATDDDTKAALNAAYERMIAGVKFREAPHFMEQKVIGSVVDIDLPRTFACHPETWANMPDDFHQLFELIDDATWRAQMKELMR